MRSNIFSKELMTCFRVSSGNDPIDIYQATATSRKGGIYENAKKCIWEWGNNTRRGATWATPRDLGGQPSTHADGGKGIDGASFCSTRLPSPGGCQSSPRHTAD